jgi:hypothetical protein
MAIDVVDLDGIADLVEGSSEEDESEQQLAAAPVDFEENTVDVVHPAAHTAGENKLVKELRQYHGASDWGTGEWLSAKSLEEIDLRATEYMHLHDECACAHDDVVAAIVYLLH